MSSALFCFTRICAFDRCRLTLPYGSKSFSRPQLSSTQGRFPTKSIGFSSLPPALLVALIRSLLLIGSKSESDIIEIDAAPLLLMDAPPNEGAWALHVLPERPPPPRTNPPPRPAASAALLSRDAPP